MVNSDNLRLAKKQKKDEFYTQYADIEAELKHYVGQLKDKTVYMPCNDVESDFWEYFHLNFNQIGLKKIIATDYNPDGKGYGVIYSGGNDRNIKDCERFSLNSDGDFRSIECTEILQSVDVVVTNPPFSLFRDFVDWLINNQKQFLIWGNNNAITYKNVFPLIQSNQIQTGYLTNKTCYFKLSSDYSTWDSNFSDNKSDGKYGKVPAITTFTNLAVEKSNNIVFCKKFRQKDNPAYDNYAAFEVSKVKDIPINSVIKAEIDKDKVVKWKAVYEADLEVVEDNDTDKITVKINRPIFGVPITFADMYVDNEFEIVGITDRQNSSGVRIHKYQKSETNRANDLNARSVIKSGSNYKSVYARILIRKK